MPSFDAGALVKPLDYTFQPFHKDAGTVPEPNDRQVADFLTGMKKIFADAGRLMELADKAEGADQDSAEGMDPAAMLDALNQLDGDEFVSISEQMCDTFAALCSHKPTSKTLREVPIRPRRLFFTWIQEEALNPEAAPAAGTAGATSQGSAATA